MSKWSELITKSTETLRHFQKVAPRLKLLIYGDSKSGKTHMCSTARKPILLHSFEPDGTSIKAFSPLVEEKSIILDTRFELQQDWEKPKAFKTWIDEMNKLRTSNMFEHLGTYVLDSSTTWVQAIMNYTLQKAGKTGRTPEIQMYNEQSYLTLNWLSVLMSLPCDVIITGHFSKHQNPVTNRFETSLLVPNKLGPQILSNISNIVVTQVKSSKTKAPIYNLQTKPDGYMVAGGRMGNNWNPEEPQDIKNLLRKAGLSTDDLEY